MTTGHDPFEIVAESAPTLDERTLVLTRGDSFVVLDRHGEMHAVPASRHGLYFDGTRFLSELCLRVAGQRPLLLSSGIRSDDAGLFVHEANPDIRLPSPVVRDVIHIVRRIGLVDGRCSFEIVLHSFAHEAIDLCMELGFDADFADVFEVRGARRARRGRRLPPTIDRDALELGYVGLDGVTRLSRVRFELPPTRLDARTAAYDLHLDGGKSLETSFLVEMELRERGASRPGSFAVRGDATDRRDLAGRLVTSSVPVNAWIRRSSSDLAMLTVSTAHGPYPYAGVPWFGTPFGRDALVTGYELLWLDPALARGVLRFLAATQATATDPSRDAEPGKIVHEMRGGEMAALGEVPFGRYYGSADATPLFVFVAAAFHDRTGDDPLLLELWPHLERALDWIDGPGDADGDGFVEYPGRGRDGLANQGWKDSRDAIMHEDGSLAEGPIALCEVQAFVYGAKRGLARVARRLGRSGMADALDSAAEALRERFARAFWCEDLGTYALALDGRKRPCRVRASNAGLALLTGLARPEHAATLARTLLSPDHFSGWGVRTLSASSARYNPMSYHDGSVWPHDNALIAAGLARYGDTRAAATILGAVFDAARGLEDTRLPELLCGFERSAGEPPTLYPVACSPQAWAAGAVFLLFQAVLGISCDAARRELRLARPTLPAFVEQLTLFDLTIGDASLDVLLERSGDTVDVRVLRRSGGELDVVLAS